MAGMWRGVVVAGILAVPVGLLAQAAKPAPKPEQKKAAAAAAQAAAKEADSNGAPAHPVTQAQVQKLMEISHAAERMREGFHKMMQQQKQALPPIFPDAFWSDLETELNKIDWVAMATPVYQRHMSEEDAARAIEFYSTAAGKRTLDSSTAVMEEMSQKAMALGKAAGDSVAQKYRPQIEENARKFQQQQREKQMEQQQSSPAPATTPAPGASKAPAKPDAPKQ